MSAWDVSKTTRVCAASEKELVEGETIFSALLETEERFERRDYCLTAWPDVQKEQFLSFWRTTVRSEKDRKPRLVIDVEAFYTFFSNLENPETESRAIFRYLLALILIRKRVLRLDSIEKRESGEALLCWDNRAKSDLRIQAPQVTPERLEEARENLNQIFDCQFDE